MDKITIVPKVLECLPKEIQQEYLVELNAFQANIDRYRHLHSITLHECINCIEWSNTEKGFDYWQSIAGGGFVVPFYEKYLK